MYLSCQISIVLACKVHLTERLFWLVEFFNYFKDSSERCDYQLLFSTLWIKKLFELSSDLESRWVKVHRYWLVPVSNLSKVNANMVDNMLGICL